MIGYDVRFYCARSDIAMIYKIGFDLRDGISGNRWAIRVSRHAASLMLALSILVLPALSWAQGKPAAGKGGAPPAQSALGPDQVRINVGVSTAKPTDIIDIPLTLSTPDVTKATSITETVSFPKDTLSLDKAELGLAGEQSQAEIKTDVKADSSNPAASQVVVTVSSKSPLKPGILAYMKFKVSDKAKKGTVVLKIVDSKADGAGGAALTAVKGKDGEVTIFNSDEEIPIVGCFFFSH
jgi:hypothetical protein